MSNGQDTILLVEDSVRDVLLIKRAFRKADISHPIQVVNDGDAAVSYLAGKEPYIDRTQYPLPVLILLDLKLPRRSGSEVLMWIRQQAGLRRLPIVVLTASKEYGDINHIYDLGANAYMVKPFAFDDLVKIVETLNLHWLVFNEKPEMNNS